MFRMLARLQTLYGLAREMRNVFLIGPMGSGKSTIGLKLAERLGLQFHDSDQLIQERTGVNINLIFEIEGEEGFRERESRVLDELSSTSNVLVATGGGAVLRQANRQILSERGVVVYLQASVDQQLARLRHDKSRPLIQLEDREAKLIQLASEREPLYAEIADFTFPSRNRSVEQSVERIYRTLQAKSGNLQADLHD
jgi:shikimate kinase